MKVLMMLLMVTMSCLSGSALASGNIAAGKAKSNVCSACHGADGVAVIPAYPSLKGQSATYIENALMAYKSGQRSGGMAGIMQAQVSHLSKQDIADLAAYFSSIK